MILVFSPGPYVIHFLLLSHDVLKMPLNPNQPTIQVFNPSLIQLCSIQCFLILEHNQKWNYPVIHLYSFSRLTSGWLACFWRRCALYYMSSKPAVIRCCFDTCTCCFYSFIWLYISCYLAAMCLIMYTVLWSLLRNIQNAIFQLCNIHLRTSIIHARP